MGDSQGRQAAPFSDGLAVMGWFWRAAVEGTLISPAKRAPVERALLSPTVDDVSPA